MILDEHFDRRILPPIKSMMRPDERITAYRFLSACIDKANHSLKELEKIPSEHRPVWFSNDIRYWKNVISGLAWAQHLTGVTVDAESTGECEPF